MSRNWSDKFKSQRERHEKDDREDYRRDICTIPKLMEIINQEMELLALAFCKKSRRRASVAAEKTMASSAATSAIMMAFLALPLRGTKGAGNVESVSGGHGGGANIVNFRDGARFYTPKKTAAAIVIPFDGKEQAQDEFDWTDIANGVESEPDDEELPFGGGNTFRAWGPRVSRRNLSRCCLAAHQTSAWAMRRALRKILDHSLYTSDDAKRRRDNKPSRAN
jgi:hypothetical protein